MKKSLFALAALSAFATAAQAQSSVTLYGNMDASIQAIQNGGLDPNAVKTDGSLTTAGNTAKYMNSQPATANATPALVDGAIATSVWGMKGSEDLGGGLKATFDAQSDLLVNNGTEHSSGLFRRAANVGLGGSFGSVFLGLKSNPLADASSASFAVGGNTVHQIRSVIGYSSTDFIKNGIQYATPNLSGFEGRLAYGMSDTIGDSTDGTIMAGSLVYTTGGLRLTGAYNKATAGLMTLQTGANAQLALTQSVGTSTSAPNSLGSTYPMFNSAAQTGAYDQSGYILGAKYNFAGLGLPALTLSYNFAHGEQTAYSVAASNVTYSQSKTASSNANMVSLGYQATPNLLLGANWIGTTADSSLYNFQARYSLSKRTTAYFQASMAKNGAGSWSDGSAYGNFMPVNVNSSSNQVVGAAGTANIGGYGLVSGSSFSGGLPNTSTSAYGVGLIHSF